VREEALEAHAGALLAKLRLPQSFLDYALKKLRTAHAGQARASEAARRVLQQRVNGCQQQLDALLGLKISPGNAAGQLLSDEEYLRQKTALKQELETARAELATALSQAEGWIDDCEQFLAYSQSLPQRFLEMTPDERKGLLHLVFRTLTLQGGKLAVEYRKPYSALASFGLAGTEENYPSEPALAASESEKHANSAMWLVTLNAIRTYLEPWKKIPRNIATIATHPFLG